MATHVASYLDFVRGLRGSSFYEQALDLSRWVPGGFGRADCVNLHRRTLRVVDLKYGRGVPVSAERNPQLMLYALGAFDTFGPITDPDRVVLVAHQPRLDTVSEWEVSVRSLLAWGGGEVRRRAAAALAPGAPRIPGDQCRFCLAKPTCPALARLTEATTMVELGGEPPPPERLTDEQVRRALDARDTVLDWFRSIEDLVRERVACGGFPGWKLVAGRANRAWGDPAEAERVLASLLGDGAFTRTLLTPAAAERAVGRGGREALPAVVRGEGRPTLVQEDDGRPALAAVVSGDFDDLSTGDASSLATAG